MRGILRNEWPKAPSPGIIPAHAGNTVTKYRKQLLKGDHPRSCGEYLKFEIKIDLKPGSSPLMRGIRITPKKSISYTGIIPAHAGNTIASSKSQKIP